MYPGTFGGRGEGDSLEERKRQLLRQMLGQHNQTGLTGNRAMPLFGGSSRGGSDHPFASMPAISFNPFLAMASGRPGEQFQAPNGITQAALMQAQNSFAPTPGGGSDADPGAPQNAGRSGISQAAAAFLGSGLGSGGAVAGSPAAAPANPNPTYGTPPPSGSNAVYRHMTDNPAYQPSYTPFFDPRVIRGNM